MRAILMVVITLGVFAMLQVAAAQSGLIPERCDLEKGLLTIHPSQPVTGLYIGLASDGGRLKNRATYCYDYVVINFPQSVCLEFEWIGVPVRTLPGSCLAAGQSVAWGPIETYDPPQGPFPRRFRYGRGLLYEIPPQQAQAYEPPVERIPPTPSGGRLKSTGLKLVNSSSTVDFDVILTTAFDDSKRFFTKIQVLSVHGDVRLAWYPRSDDDFIKTMNADGIGRPYRLKPGSIEPEALKLPNEFQPQNRRVLAQVWIGNTPALEAYLPAVVPVSVRPLNR